MYYEKHDGNSECDSCNDLSNELDDTIEELAHYKAKEFIAFVEALHGPKCHFARPFNKITQEQIDLREKFGRSYEFCIAAYMHSTLTEQTFKIIAEETNEAFMKNIVTIYKRQFGKNPFEKRVSNESN